MRCGSRTTTAEAPPGAKEHLPVTASDLTQRLVDSATAWDHPDPVAAARGAGVAFADTVACAIAGLADPAVAAYARATGHSPFDATIPAADCARATGLAAHALDYDDVDDATISHPSAAVVPALLAVAQTREGDRALAPSATGADAVTALHRGLAVGRMLGEALGVRAHYEAGWHTTSTIGTVAAAAAVGSLAGLDAARMRTAFGIAGSLAQGSRQNFGSMTKPLHAGQAAHNAVLAVSLAREGFTADADLLEGPLGFLALHRGPGTAPPVTDAYPAMPHLNVKLYPCCYYTHAAADAAQEVREALASGSAIDTGSIQSVHVTVQPGGLAPLIHQRPADGTQAKFSMEYVIAAMLTDGAVTLGTFAPETVSRPDLQDLLTRVTTAEAPVPPAGPAAWNAGYAVIEATLADGSTVTRRVDRPRGHATRPVDDATLRAKVDDCLDYAGADTSRAAQLFETLVHVAEQGSLADVAALVATVAESRGESRAETGAAL